MINNQGWILLYRKLLESEMWRALTSMQRDLLIACLLKANHKTAQWEYNKEIYTCEPGEFITSLENLRKLCAKGTSIKMVRTGLKKLEKWSFLAHDGANTGSKITIINWGVYQNYGTPRGIPSGKDGADDGQSRGKDGATNNNNKQELNNNKQEPFNFSEIELETEFNKIYTLYPNKSSKSKAHKYFCSMELDREIIAKMHAVINYSKKSSNKWEKSQFVPYLVNWLINKEYLDDIPVSNTKPRSIKIDKPIRVNCEKHGIVEVTAHYEDGVMVSQEDCDQCNDEARLAARETRLGSKAN